MQHWIEPLEPSRTRLWFRQMRRRDVHRSLVGWALIIAVANAILLAVAYPEGTRPAYSWSHWVFTALLLPVALLAGAGAVKWGFTGWPVLQVQESSGGAELDRLVSLWRALPEPERTQMAPVARAAYAEANKRWANEIDRDGITARLRLMEEMANEVELAKQEAKQEAPDLAEARAAIDAKRIARGSSAEVRAITEQVERRVSGE